MDSKAVLTNVLSAVRLFPTLLSSPLLYRFLPPVGASFPGEWKCLLLWRDKCNHADGLGLLLTGTAPSSSFSFSFSFSFSTGKKNTGLLKRNGGGREISLYEPFRKNIPA